MADNAERTRTITRREDGGFTIRFVGEQTSQTLTLSAEELLALAGDLEVWRWRLTGDSYDPSVHARIREESLTLL